MLKHGRHGQSTSWVPTFSYFEFWNLPLLMGLQVLTDRFAKTSSSSTSACSDLSSYCGGTWKGMEQRLDYIQGLGFDAIWITPIVTSRL